jgi:hypothetical protein
MTLRILFWFLQLFEHTIALGDDFSQYGTGETIARRKQREVPLTTFLPPRPMLHIDSEVRAAQACRG